MLNNLQIPENVERIEMAQLISLLFSHGPVEGLGITHARSVLIFFLLLNLVVKMNRPHQLQIGFLKVSYQME